MRRRRRRACEKPPLPRGVEASFTYALHATGESQRPTDDVLLQRLPELHSIECLRSYMLDGQHDQSGWFAALADPVVDRALQLMRAHYARPWTLDTLAREAATSRSRLDEHFRRHLGIAPMAFKRYAGMSPAAWRRGKD